jgi:predicted  nucleic acid-binding Zn-ribbon protein
MFCSNCGKKFANGSKFCPKCGTKVVNTKNSQDDDDKTVDENEEDDGEVAGLDTVNQLEESKHVTTTEVATIPQLKDQLLAMRDAENSDAALTYAVEAQLQVLDVLNSPAMTSSCFELMIESLYKALQKTPDEQQQKELQYRAAIMAQNMIFFMEAKLRYEENKHSEQGKALLKKGCSLLAESASGIMTGGISGGVKIMSGKLFDNLMHEDGFFNMLFDFITKKERIEKNNKEFDDFIVNFFGKLDRYRSIFGKSILLSELVHRYKERLINRQKVYEPDSPFGMNYRPTMWLKSFFLIGLLTGFTIIPVLLKLMSEDTWGIIPPCAVALWVSVNIIYLITCIISSVREKSAYKKAMAAFDKHNEILETYYTSIADSYNVLDSAKPDSSVYKLSDLKPLEATLLKYERLHDRIEEKQEGKSWITCVVLCIFLGWMGAHRFYVGRTFTGILMICLLPSGISIIWAIIDLILIFSGKFTDSDEDEIKLVK